MPPDPNMPVWARIVRRVTRWLVVLAILAVVSRFGFLFIGRTLCRLAISQMAEMTNSQIETGSVDFRSNGSVFIEELVVNPQENEGRDETILRAGKLHASFDVGSLFALKPKLRRIDVNDFVFNAQYDVASGNWNLSSIKLDFGGRSAGTMPLVSLENGTLQYTRISGSESKIAASMPLSARLEYDPQTKKGYRFDINTDTQARGFGDSKLTGLWKPGQLEITGGIASTDISEFEMEWTIDYMAAELKYDQNDLFTLDMRIFDFRSARSPELDNLAVIGSRFIEKSTPFTALRKLFETFKPRGHADISLKASGNLKKLSEATLSGILNCRDVGIVYEEFPYKLEHLKGKVDFTEDSVTLNNLSVNHGAVELSLDGWTRGFGRNWKCDFRIASKNMKLDSDLYEALWPSYKKSWSLFSPSGVAEIDYRLVRSSPDSRARHLAVELKGVDAEYRVFPYPLKNLSGSLTFEQRDVIISNVVSDSGGRRIALDGKVTGRGTSRSGYDISIAVEGIPLDSVLHEALPEQQKSLYDQFSPTGTVGGVIKVSKSELPGVPSSFTAELSMQGGSLKSERLPLPLTDITASAVLTPDQIDIRSFSGGYGETPVSLEGQIWPGQKDQPSRYSLALEFKDTLLNEELFRLLPPSAGKIVADFQPQGKINLTAEMSKLGPKDSADYEFRIGCLGNSVNLPQFSYPLKDITGELTITPNSIEFRDVNAVPGDSVWIRLSTAFIRLDGTVWLEENAFKNALFKIQANDIFFDRRLGAAMPVGLHPLYNKLVPPAHFDLDLEEVSIKPALEGKNHIDIKGRARLEECSPLISGIPTRFNADLNLEKLIVRPVEKGERLIEIDGFARLENFSMPISGANARLDSDMRISGVYRTNYGFEKCSLRFDGQSFKILGKTFDNPTTQIDYDPELQQWKGNRLTAGCYDGKLIGKLELSRGSDSVFGYTLQTSFQDVDLRKFLSDSRMASGEGDYTKGKMSGSLNISARLGDNSTRLGACRLSIMDMQVGRLSPLAKLLDVLQFREPSKYAFEEMFLDSYIKADNLHVRKLDLSGRSSAFYGSGLVDLRTRKIDLGLIARGKRHATADPSVIGSLAEGLGSAVVQIDVIGDFYDPQVITRPLPFIKETLGIFGIPAEPK